MQSKTSHLLASCAVISNVRVLICFVCFFSISLFVGLIMRSGVSSFPHLDLDSLIFKDSWPFLPSWRWGGGTCFVEKLIQTLEHEECNKSPVWDVNIAAFRHL